MFDGPDTLFVAQRGVHLGSYDYSAFTRPQESTVLRYTWNATSRRWDSAPSELAVGLQSEHHATLGGLALNYGYDRLGKIDYGRCRETLWTTGEHLRAGSDLQRIATGGPPHVNGIQGIYKSRLRPEHAPPLESWFVDFDAVFGDHESFGHIGNVGIFAPCQGSVITTAATDVRVPIWTKGPNLVVEKRCKAGALGGRVHCVIVVRNRGDETASETIELVDATRVLWGPGAGKVIPLATVRPDGTEWSCQVNADGDYACRLPANLIGPGTYRQLEVWFETQPLVLAGNVGYRNCATINHPNGVGKACAEGGGDIIVRKTGPVDCRAGTDCRFGITITNTTTEPYSGDVLLSDSLLLGGKVTPASITSISPPLGCKEDPKALPFACVSKLALAAGESRTHWITVMTPAKPNAWFQNCFGLTDPWLLNDTAALERLLTPIRQATGALPSGHPSCVWVRIPGPPLAPAKAPTPEYQSFAGTWNPTLASSFSPPGDVSRCADGRSPLASGRCPCPVSAPYDPDTGSCRARPVCWDKIRLRHDGTCCPTGSVYWPQTRTCQAPPQAGCPDVWRRGPDGNCCPSGTRLIDGACRTPPLVFEPCPWGTVRAFAGICIPIPVPPVVVQRCPDGRIRQPNGFCPPIVCQASATFNPRGGKCDPLPPPGTTPPKKCPGNLVFNALGSCVPSTTTRPDGPPKGPTLPPCPLSLTRNPQGKCGPTIPLTPTKGTATDTPRGCPGNLVLNAQGVCVVAGTGGTTRNCGPGQRLSNGGCVPDVRVPPVKPIPPTKSTDTKTDPKPPTKGDPPKRGDTPPPKKVDPPPPKKVEVPTKRIEPKVEKKPDPPKRTEKIEKKEVPKRKIEQPKPKSEPVKRREPERRSEAPKPKVEVATRSKPEPRRIERTVERAVSRPPVLFGGAGGGGRRR